MKNEQIRQAMQDGLAVAMGCTEPVAIAYASAVARSFTAGEMIKVKLSASANIIKNAFVVGIPGTAFTGLKYAAAIGCMCKDSSKKLAVLEGLQECDMAAAKCLVESGRVELAKSAGPAKFFIEVTVQTAVDLVVVTIIGSHTNVTKITKNGKVEYNGCCGGVDGEAKTPYPFQLRDVYDYCQEADLSEFSLIQQAIVLNSAIAKVGLEEQYGLGVGRMIQGSIAKQFLADDLANHAMMLAAAASDARMAGVSLPVMSNSGSGNQGIAATMPVIGVWQRLPGKSEDELLRACALSNLATIYIKRKFGVLSALCGAVVAGSGAACGITWLMGGSFAQIENAVQNMLGNVTGMVCDGAKASCALKISTCTNAAMQAALLALNDLRVQSNEGIVEQYSERTIDNFAVLGNEGSAELDKLILDMILHKEI